MIKPTASILLSAVLCAACATAHPVARNSPVDSPVAPASTTAVTRTPPATDSSRAWIPERRLESGPGLPAPVQADAPPRRYQEGDQEFLGSVGFTSGPSMLLLAAEMDHHLDEASAIGPMLQVGLSGDDTLVGVSGHYKHSFYIEQDGDLSPFRPFAQGGLGFAYLEKDRDDDWSLLLHLGGGVQYHLNATTHVGTNILVDILPSDPAGESAIFTWQLFQIGFRF